MKIKMTIIAGLLLISQAVAAQAGPARYHFSTRQGSVDITHDTPVTFSLLEFPKIKNNLEELLAKYDETEMDCFAIKTLANVTSLPLENKTSSQYLFPQQTQERKDRLTQLWFDNLAIATLCSDPSYLKKAELWARRLAGEFK